MIVQNGHSNVISPCKCLYIKHNLVVLIWRYITLIYSFSSLCLDHSFVLLHLQIKRVDVSTCFANISLINHLGKTIDSCLTTYIAPLVFYF